MAKKKKRQQVFGLGDLYKLTGFEQPKTDTPTDKKGPKKKGGTDEKPNIGWLFFKDYYHLFDFPMTEKNGYSKKQVEDYQNDFFQQKNKRIFQQNIKNHSSHLIKYKDAESLELTTTYPGLATGTGITHESKSQGEIKLGFAFDYTTGLPYIPASSVKGLLRSVFPQKDGKKTNKYASQHREYLKSLLPATAIPQLEEHLNALREAESFDAQQEYDFIDLLEKELFEGIYPKKKKKPPTNTDEVQWEWCNKRIYDRDIFHDAYPFKSANKEGAFLGADFITPHINPLKNPKPVQFMKILPAVTIRFQFDVKDGLLKKEQKIDLFQQILLDFGIGAKTNVGYGQLTE